MKLANQETSHFVELRDPLTKKIAVMTPDQTWARALEIADFGFTDDESMTELVKLIFEPTAELDTSVSFRK